MMLRTSKTDKDVNSLVCLDPIHHGNQISEIPSQNLNSHCNNDAILPLHVLKLSTSSYYQPQLIYSSKLYSQFDP